MQSVASVPFKSFNLNAFKWARGVYQEGMRQRFAAVGASLCGHQYFLLPLSAPKFCLKSSYCFWYTTSNVPFSSLFADRKAANGTFGLLWVRSYIRVVHPAGPRVTAPFASPPWGHPLLPRLVFPPPPCRLSRLWLVTTGPDTAPDIAYHTF